MAALRKGDNRSDDGRRFRILGKRQTCVSPPSTVSSHRTINDAYPSISGGLLSVTAHARLAARANPRPPNLMRGMRRGNVFTQYFVGLTAMLSGYGSGTFAIS